MCGIVGFKGNKTPENIDLIKRLMEETQIRGKHSTGISFWDGSKIQTYKKPIPSKQFVKEFDWDMIPDKIVLIAHIRYSTSDLKYNQPIADETLAIAHNGVISQAEPEEWEKLFGYKCKTKNDSELLWHFLKENEPSDIENKFPGASYSVVGIRNGELFHFRNGLRPQWKYEDNEKLIIASTENILFRCGLDGSKIKPIGIEYIHYSMREPECKQI